MLKRILILFLAASFCLHVSAQTDSVTFTKAKWEVKKIAPGLKFKHYWFNKNLFDTSENISILEIAPHKKAKLALGFEKQILKYVADYATQSDAIAAINGGFFDVKNGGGVDVVRANGEMINTNRPGKNGNRPVHQMAALVFKNGSLSIAKWDGTADWETHLDGDVLDAGPLLIYKGTAEVLDTVSLVRLRHPRTAVAVANGKILLITIDGRNANSGGVDLHQMTKILKWLHASEAVNMDGGGSTTMYIKNETPNGIVNYPCDNKKWDHDGARKVANAVLVKIVK